MVRKTEIENTVRAQKEFFDTHVTLDVQYRIESLKRLKSNIKIMEEEILTALNKDLGKSIQEGFLTEIQTVYSALDLAIKKTKTWARPKKVGTSLLMTGKSKIIKEPYGTALIIAPFNYPFSLAIEPLIGAIAAGNTAIIKPGEVTKNTSDAIKKLISMTFDSEYVAVIKGGIEETSFLLEAEPDFVFFTGSPKTGSVILSKIGEKLIPSTMELGGKSPTIVDKNCNLKNAAKRIIWGKLMNNGQTCVAPDYVLVDRQVKDEFINLLWTNFEEMYGKADNLQENADYGRIISEIQTAKLADIIDKDREYIVFGGKTDIKDRFVEFTILDIPMNKIDEVHSMKNENFGPILPVIAYDKMEDVIQVIKHHPKPLAMYIFTEDSHLKEYLLKNISAGGVAVNDVIKHITNPNLPFGGVGSSGMGNYHGKYSFDTFSHSKSLYENKAKFNVDAIFPPYTDKKFDFIKKFIK